MPRIDNPNDPYATPHAPKERSGPVLRVAIIALLLVGAGLSWTAFSNNEDSQGLTPNDEAAVTQPIQVADSSGGNPAIVTDAGAPVAEQTAPAAPAARTPAPERAAPAPGPAPAADNAELAPLPPTTVEPLAPQ